MQYHLDGFRPGDPELHPAARQEPGPLPEMLDVLIVGCGSAGLTLAAYLAGFPDIATRIVERKPGPLEKGQADGISCRSMEMFQAYGFADTVKRQGYWVNETTFWRPVPGQPDHIQRTGRVQDVEDGLSEMPHVILNQARVHDMYLDVMRKSASRLVPDYGLELADLSVDPSGSHPVSVALQRTDSDETTVCRARYVVGCDGARSAARRAIGRELIGDSANKAWGVMDILAVTDFPDIRLKTLIQSAGEGNIIIIPREGGYLVRLYIELDKLKAGERVAERGFDIDTLISAARRIFHPYSLDVREVVWWSVYEIGQRLTDKFDDVAAGMEAARAPHVFIAGDACHTHSPKAGQGMNVSMGDAFNLGWKLVSVLSGRSPAAILHSYSAERQAVAQDLIDFDREWSRIISASPEDGAVPQKHGHDADDAARQTAAGTPAFQKYFVEHGRYTAGMSVRYAPSALIGEARWQDLARGFPIGMRFHSAPVTRLADAKPLELGHVVSADARWRLFAFCSQEDPAAPDAGLAELCRFLEADPRSPIRRITPDSADSDAVIDLRVVLQHPIHDVTITALPAFLMPRKGRLGLIDYEKVYCATPEADIFRLRGLDRRHGCLVLVRPDQYVAHVLPFDDHAGLSTFFEGVMTPVHE